MTSKDQNRVLMEIWVILYCVPEVVHILGNTPMMRIASLLHWVKKNHSPFRDTVHNLTHPAFDHAAKAAYIAYTGKLSQGYTKSTLDRALRQRPRQQWKQRIHITCSCIWRTGTTQNERDVHMELFTKTRWTLQYEYNENTGRVDQANISFVKSSHTILPFE